MKSTYRLHVVAFLAALLLPALGCSPTGETADLLRIGVIDVPTFYMDFEARTRGDENYRSTTRDVRRLIGELNEHPLDALIVDRNLADLTDTRVEAGGALTVSAVNSAQITARLVAASISVAASSTGAVAVGVAVASVGASPPSAAGP